MTYVILQVGTGEVFVCLFLFVCLFCFFFWGGGGVHIHLQGSFIRVDSIIQCVFHKRVHFADDILFIRKNLLLCFL